MHNLIVIEGLDGAGKSTQIKLLEKYLNTEGYITRFIHFPRTDAPGLYGDLVARFLRGDFGSLEVVHPQLVALIFALDRIDFLPTLQAWLANDDFVIMDRYVYSNIAYQCAKLNTTLEKQQLTQWILDFEFKKYGLPRPLLNFYLEVPEKFIHQALANYRSGQSRTYLAGKTDIHEADMAFQEKVKSEYLTLLKTQSDFLPIHCSDSQNQMLPAETIHEILVSALIARLGKKL